MVAAGALQSKIAVSKAVSRAMRLAHLLHKCAMKVRFHFQDVDQLIAKDKSVAIKNKN